MGLHFEDIRGRRGAWGMSSRGAKMGRLFKVDSEELEKVAAWVL